LVAHIKEITQVEGVQKYGDEEALRARTEEIKRENRAVIIFVICRLLQI